MKPSHQIVQLVPLGAPMDDALAQRYSVLRLTDAADPSARLAEAPDARVLITSVRRGLERQWLERLPGLAAVCSWGVGYETLDIEAARQRGIAVSNTPGVLDNCVADMAWALLFSVARRSSMGDRYVKTGQWGAGGGFPLGVRVWGKKLGVAGMGRIGSAIAARAAGFDMEVRYHNRRERPESPYAYEDSLAGLARWADFLVMACPGGPETRGIVNRDVLRALGPDGILVNISRGSVVDEAALVEALRNGELGGAGLDVFENEPHVPEALRNMDHASLMPHVSSGTRETREDMGRLVLENVVSFMETGRLATPV